MKPPKNWGLLVGVVGSVDALARGLAVDLAPVRVNSICPGAVDTEVSVQRFCQVVHIFMIPHPALEDTKGSQGTALRGIQEETDSSAHRISRRDCRGLPLRNEVSIARPVITMAGADA